MPARKLAGISFLKGTTLKRIIAIASAIALALTTSVSASAGSFTFYLNMKPGCYSYTSPTVAQYPIEGSKYKTVYRNSCNDEHHIQVIYSAVTKAKARTITEAEVYKVCTTQYRKKLGVAAPTTIQDEIPYLRYYWPDAGLERLKYNNKVICYIHAADETYDNYMQMVEAY